MMKDLILTSRNDAHAAIARFFSLNDGLLARLEVREDQCFSKGWLDLGQIALKPSQDVYPGEASEVIPQAVRHGSYEWHTPSKETLEAAVLQLVDDTNNDAQKEKLKHALIGLTHAIQRIGLKAPLFDSSFLSQLPLKRSTTIVADTNAVLQGALDFASRHLSPVARLKVPAVSQMEVSGWAANYFKMRREGKLAKYAGSGLQAHMRSQGAQRALLRLELSMQTEVERVRFGADPLRGIMQNDSDKEHANLNLQVVQQGFADRLIFETALQHLHASSPGHRVIMMTSDQGLARMCLSEGMEVAFYRAGQIEDIAGTVLTGSSFNPFGQGLRHTALADILWELAVAFGSCRLKSDKVELTVFAIGETLTWTPYHAEEDLLWITLQSHELASQPLLPEAPDRPLPEPTLPPAEAETENPKPAGDIPINRDAYPDNSAAVDITQTEDVTSRVPEVIEPSTAEGSKNLLGPHDLDDEDEEDDSNGNQNDPVETAGKKSFVAAYKFSPATMLRLVQAISAAGALTTSAVMSKFHFTHERKVQEYRGFLVSSDLITFDQGTLTATTRLHTLWEFLKTNEFSALAPLLCSSPAMQAIQEKLQVGIGIPSIELPVRDAAAPGYICLLELTGEALEIHEVGVFATPNRPYPKVFSDLAYQAYIGHAKTEGTYIASGIWLETMARDYGVHPLWSRRMLEEARLQRLIERYVEGSTPDTRFSRHTFCMSESAQGSVAVRKVALFEGDFLLPGKSSASLRLKRPS